LLKSSNSLSAIVGKCVNKFFESVSIAFFFADGTKLKIISSKRS